MSDRTRPILSLGAGMLAYLLSGIPFTGVIVGGSALVYTTAFGLDTPWTALAASLPPPITHETEQKVIHLDGPAPAPAPAPEITHWTVSDD